MTMELVKTSEIKKEEIFYPMYQMKKGEICFCKDEGQYVLKVGHSDQQDCFLILDNSKEINSYGEGCGLWVRKLYPNESVTIKFS